MQNSRTGAMPFTYNAVSFFDTNFSSNVLAAAIGDAYGKLRGDTDLSIDLVQWRQMVAMAASYRKLVLTTIARAAYIRPLVSKTEMAIARLQSGRRQRLSRRRLKRLAREVNSALNTLAQQRLAYMYGIKPTMQSLHDLAVQAITPKEPGHIRIEGRGKDVYKYTAFDSSIDSRRPAKHVINASYRARVVMYFSPSGDVLEKLGGISSLNPVSIAYELIPFSFVLDWAVDIGGWIRSLETAFLHRNNFAGGYQTQTMAVTVGSEMTGVNATNLSGAWAFYELQGNYVMRRLLRSGLVNAPFQAAPIRPLSLGSTRGLNAIALAKTVLLRADELLRHKR